MERKWETPVEKKCLFLIQNGIFIDSERTEEAFTSLQWYVYYFFCVYKFSITNNVRTMSLYAPITFRKQNVYVF